MPITNRRNAAFRKSVQQPKTHHISHKLETRLRPEIGGYGVYATEVIEAGELLVMWGGEIVTAGQLDNLDPVARRHSIQVEEDMFLCPSQLPEPGDFINHSCDPNAGLSGQIGLVAVRRIEPGEEICYDYAMSDGTPYDEFTCECGSHLCRSRVTGNDWMLPELQIKYGKFFSPYLQRRIKQMHADDALRIARVEMKTARRSV